MDLFNLQLIYKGFHHISLVIYLFSLLPFLVGLELIHLAHFILIVATVRHLEFVILLKNRRLRTPVKNFIGHLVLIE